jgi:hypothetical protein
MPGPTRGSRRDTTRSLMLLGVLLAGLVVARWSVTGSLTEPVAPPAPTVPDAGPERAPAVPELRGNLLYLGGRRPLIVDAGSGALASLPGEEANPTRVLRQGRFLLLTADRRVSVLLPGNSDGWTRPRQLGPASAVLPSPHPERAWLVLEEEANPPDRTYTLQEIALADGRRLASFSLPYDARPIAMVAQGVVTRDLGAGLQVRDLKTRRVRQRLGTNITFLDARGSLVAFLAADGLHIRDLATGSDRVVEPPAAGPSWYALGQPLAGAGCCQGFAAFAPDGRSLALFVRLAGPEAPGVALVDLTSNRAVLLPGSAGATPLGCWPCLGWSSDGWLFFFSGAPPPNAVAAWRPGRPRASLLNIELDDVSGAVPNGLAAA